jgi:heat shock protein HtpX
MNVVREMATAANVPMPKVYVIDDTAPNAFATGRDPAHASIAVTTGLLQKLDREELQGVIGHELSHVRNLDIRFALLVATLADFFRVHDWVAALPLPGRHGRPRATAAAGRAAW